MKHYKILTLNAVCAASVLGLCLVCGCNKKPAVTQHPDEIDSVNNALLVNGLTNIKVSQDRTNGVMTLTGTVASPDQKAEAAKITSINASDYSVTNNIGVTTAPAQAKTASDDEIKDKYQALLKAHKDLERQQIDCKVDRGTMILAGSVDAASERAEALKLAREVPNVQKVVDKIKVHS